MMQFGDLSETILSVSNNIYLSFEKMYADQRANVLTDVESDEFDIGR